MSGIDDLIAEAEGMVNDDQPTNAGNHGLNGFRGSQNSMSHGDSHHSILTENQNARLLNGRNGRNSRIT